MLEADCFNEVSGMQTQTLSAITPDAAMIRHKTRNRHTKTVTANCELFFMVAISSHTATMLQTTLQECKQGKILFLLRSRSSGGKKCWAGAGITSREPVIESNHNLLRPF